MCACSRRMIEPCHQKTDKQEQEDQPRASQPAAVRLRRAACTEACRGVQQRGAHHEDQRERAEAEENGLRLRQGGRFCWQRVRIQLNAASLPTKLLRSESCHTQSSAPRHLVTYPLTCRNRPLFREPGRVVRWRHAILRRRA